MTRRLSHVFAPMLIALALAGCTRAETTPQPAPVATASVSATIAPSAPATATAEQVLEPTTFAIIGDYGTNDSHERQVANLVASWKPAFVIALGDDYYSQAGGTGMGRYLRSTGAYYGEWVGSAVMPTAGSPPGEATVNGFFPTLGNHDYSDATPSPQTYLDYFTLPGTGFTSTSDNERYYDFVLGPIHFFALNSNPDEPDGITADSKQAAWLKTQLAASTSEYNIVFDHHPPYSSDNRHGSTAELQWPFAKWGADIVLSGHAHTYERVVRDGTVYFVNGLGGATRYGFGAPIKGSRVRYSDEWGAQKVTITDKGLSFEFYCTDGSVKDRYRVFRQ